MIIEHQGSWLIPRQGWVDVITDEPHECAVCHRMTAFFENRNGATRCTGCEGQEQR
jgi:hypothetical protein